MRSSIVALLVALVVFASACGGPSAGTVYSKEHQPRTETWMVLMMPMSCGTNCTMSVPIMFWVVDDEDWVLSIKDKKGDTNDLYVSEAAYNATEIGTWYDEKAPTSDDYKKYDKKPR